MTDVTVVPPDASVTATRPAQRRRRRRWMVASVVLTLVAIGVGIGVTSYRVAHPYLPEAYNFAWGPDEGPAKDSSAGGSSEYDVASRPNARQTMFVAVANSSHSPLTLLAPRPEDTGETSRRLQIAFSAQDADHSSTPKEAMTYRSSVTIPPDGTRYIRYTFRARNCFSVGGRQYWNNIPVRIRSHGITTDQQISMGSTWMGVYGTATSCPGGV